MCDDTLFFRSPLASFAICSYSGFDPSCHTLISTCSIPLTGTARHRFAKMSEAASSFTIALPNFLIAVPSPRGVGAAAAAAAAASTAWMGRWLRPLFGRGGVTPARTWRRMRMGCVAAVSCSRSTSVMPFASSPSISVSTVRDSSVVSVGRPVASSSSADRASGSVCRRWCACRNSFSTTRDPHRCCSSSGSEWMILKYSPRMCTLPLQSMTFSKMRLSSPLLNRRWSLSKLEVMALCTVSSTPGSDSSDAVSIAVHICVHISFSSACSFESSLLYVAFRLLPPSPHSARTPPPPPPPPCQPPLSPPPPPPPPPPSQLLPQLPPPLPPPPPPQLSLAPQLLSPPLAAGAAVESAHFSSLTLDSSSHQFPIAGMCMCMCQ
eukprot:Rhum_TRINITY_DN8328_c0_g1::Rhum_TRINITY_DN8328_c0_g1_i1::g.27384::m.27384